MHACRWPRRTAATLSALLVLTAWNAGLSGLAQAPDRTARSIYAEESGRAVRVTNGDVRFRVNLDRRCVIDSLWVGTTLLAGAMPGGFTGVRVDSISYSTSSLTDQPLYRVTEDSVRIWNIRYAAGRDTITEEWGFLIRGDDILWTIQRSIPRALVLEDNAFPGIQIDSIDMFDGALLGNGGAAWFRLFNDSAVAYGIHTDEALLWSMRGQRCLRIAAHPVADTPALALSRVGRTLRCTFSAAPAELVPRFDEGTHRRRFVRGRTDVWQASSYPAGTYRQRVRISAPDFHQALGRGDFKGMSGESITALLNTTARIGVIDSKLYGGNSWHTPYGPICIQEQYIAQFGLSINDSNYTKGYQACLDYYRDHAIQPDGRIKARWAYTNEDAIPGTADSLGFYEAQWGIMMDSQPDFVINVAEHFDQCGDLQWLRSHKASCENVLEYMLRRDSDNDRLVEVLTDSHREGRGSDWLDIVWASWENAFVNAEVYRALTLWSDLEDLMGDSSKATAYRRFAAGLKESYNKPTAQGGFWDEQNHWYVHWREKDGAVYGNNLVTPVNFMAIGYGLCDDPERKLAILHAIEAGTQKENLFFWPLCMYPYEPGTVHQNNLPFPTYENGDLFLSWGELGVRAYADDFPEIALRYVRNVLQQYEKDGLAYQRYLRTTQNGSGDDILAGNASAVTGLFRNIYGIQPAFNRLHLRPRLVKELYGTRLRYVFRGKSYLIALDGPVNGVTIEGATVRASGDFGIMRERSRVLWYSGASVLPALALAAHDSVEYSVTVLEWGDRRAWSERSLSGAGSIVHEFAGLRPRQDYVVMCDGHMMETLRAGETGDMRYVHLHGDTQDHLFELRPTAVPAHLRGTPLFALARPVISPGDSIAFSPATVRVRITHEAPGTLIRYTQDGSDPTEQSLLYAGPFSLHASTVIRARAFRTGFGPSEIASATYTVLPLDFRGIVQAGAKVYAFHQALHKPVTLTYPYQSRYAASGSNALTDGVVGGESYNVDWQGFEREDLEATIDLGSVTTIDSVRSGFFQDQRLWIFFPLDVDVWVSTDGSRFVPLAPLEVRETSWGGEPARRDYVYRGKSVSARYVRVRAKNQGVCPPGHPGAGGKAWLFADEIVVQ